MLYSYHYLQSYLVDAEIVELIMNPNPGSLFNVSSTIGMGIRSMRFLTRHLFILSFCSAGVVWYETYGCRLQGHP